MPRRQTLRGLWLALCAASSVGAQCGTDEEPVKALTARRDLLVSEWRPKAEFWAEVERKGVVAKQTHAIADEIAAQTAEVARLEVVIETARAELESARATTQQVRALRAQRASELQRVASELGTREQRLRDFERRRRARGAE